MNVYQGNFMDWLKEKLEEGYSISGYESLANDIDVRDENWVHGKTIKVYATKTSDQTPLKEEIKPVNFYLPSETEPRTVSGNKKDSISQG